jgi:outer membrane autotransporter protein
MDFTVSNFVLTSEVKEQASHKQYSNQVLAHLGGGYAFKVKMSSHETLKIYPFANVDYFYLLQGGYKEHGAGSLDLKVNSKKYDYLRPEAGLGCGYRGCFEHHEALFNLSASYVREFRYLGQKTKSHFEAAPACNFTVTGLNPENNLFCPSASVSVASIKKGFSISLKYHGEYGAHFNLSAGEAEVRVCF